VQTGDRWCGGFCGHRCRRSHRGWCRDRARNIRAGGHRCLSDRWLTYWFLPNSVANAFADRGRNRGRSRYGFWLQRRDLCIYHRSLQDRRGLFVSWNTGTSLSWSAGCRELEVNRHLKFAFEIIRKSFRADSDAFELNPDTTENTADLMILEQIDGTIAKLETKRTTLQQMQVVAQTVFEIFEDIDKRSVGVE
jgi:hypothetical protein